MYGDHVYLQLFIAGKFSLHGGYYGPGTKNEWQRLEGYLTGRSYLALRSCDSRLALRRLTASQSGACREAIL